MRLRSILGPMLAVAMALPTAQSAAQTEMREDVFEVQTALHFYGFIPGPVDGVLGPETVRGLDNLGRYLKLGPVGASALDAEVYGLPLQTLLDTYATRNASFPMDLDETDAARYRQDGERFWLRKTLQPDPTTWGVDTPAAADECGAWDAAGLIGQEIDPGNPPKPEGADMVRVIYFGPVTMDFRPTRLNMRIDPWDVVTNLSCE